ncbi:Single-stranded DNA-binding protein [Geodia barretti]|uniref:Single-stranded DNA-binding protein n=1 Tax=Geodia barretti TaxID=519541 RepID=A0AA35W130_GEOBA|nr:Single-stranded DNA-binding protein [Geodia barretti]
MASFNKVILMGNLTRDPEVKFLPSGTAVANFGLAMNESYTDQQTGEKKESACFVDVEAWGKQAEIVGEYFTKGKPILVEGALKYDAWEAEDGTKRNRLKVRLIRFQFVGGKRDEDEMGGGYADAQPAAAPTQSASYQDAPAPEASSAPSATEDDIPF